MTLSEELTARGFIHQFSAETLAEIIDGDKRTVYLGVDPSADSIHAGNFVLFMLLSHLANHGHHVILLIGGGTGMIGDPKPDVERPLTPPEEVAARVQKLRVQAQRLLKTDSITFVNNHDWLGSLNLITFLRDIGKHFTVNELIKKDAIATRLSSENGISYTEFAYPLLQAYDYLELHEQQQCNLQIGGSDQWGNIIAGVELIRKKKQTTVYALTAPLIVDKTTGKKFGKSEANAVWLDSEKTSPYEFYQFWLNVSDANVIDYLKLFTFLSLSEISELEQLFLKNPGQREAQQTLASLITALVHGQETASATQAVSNLLFGEGNINALNETERAMLRANAPVLPVSASELLVDVLVRSQLAISKREARTFIESGAISINGEKVSDVEAVIMSDFFSHGLAVLKRGKKSMVVLEEMTK